jgi:hypothetical protein
MERNDVATMPMSEQGPDDVITEAITISVEPDVTSSVRSLILGQIESPCTYQICGRWRITVLK